MSSTVKNAALKAALHNKPKNISDFRLLAMPSNCKASNCLKDWRGNSTKIGKIAQVKKRITICQQTITAAA